MSKVTICNKCKKQCQYSIIVDELEISHHNGDSYYNQIDLCLECAKRTRLVIKETINE